MYDRILQILLESSAARRAQTRATIAGAMAANPGLADRLSNQKSDPLARRQAVAAKKAKAQRVQKQGQSQPAVRTFAGGRKAATAAGYRLTGTLRAGPGGSRQPRIAPGQPSIKQKLQALRARRAERGEQQAAPRPGPSPAQQRFQRNLRYQEFKRGMKKKQQRAAAMSKKQQPQATTIKIADQPKFTRQTAQRATPTTVQPTSSQTGKATKPGAGNIQQALQGGGTTITQVGLKKLAPFLRAGLRTSKVGPVI